jgi:hypothetical protein
MYRMLFAALLGVTAGGQTLVNLNTQTKNVDFTTAAFTRPVKTGTTLPSTCTVGDLFFQTSAPAGSNLYGCASTNTWMLESGSGGGGGGGSLAIDNNGTLVGSRSVVNLIGGLGMVNTISDTGTQISVQQSVDTSVIPSKATAQSGVMWLCASTGSSSSAYTCGLSPTLPAYSTGMVLAWKPNVNGAGGATTLNVDTLGSVAVKQADGATDPTGADIVAGRLYDVWYDGAVFRLMTPAVNVAAAAAQPGCDATQRGRLWQTLGGTGSKDTVTVCAKDASEAYAWRTIY